MTYLYILQSQSSGRYYIGISDDLPRRITEHNSGQTPSTRHRGPWSLVYTEVYPTRGEAMVRESLLKSWKSHQAIAELVTRQR